METIENQTFATLDTTHLLYRVDQLIPVGLREEKREEKKEDIRRIIEQERELASTLREEFSKSDEMCDGGG